MKSLSGLGIGLSLVFACLFLALVAEIYYLLWWKKRTTTIDIEDNNNYSTFGRRGFCYFLCWKKPSSLSSIALNPQELSTSMRITDTHDLESEIHHLNSDFLLKPFGEDNVDAELMRLHNLSGPPRFLFTIKEETKEDLEDEDGKTRYDKSLKGSRGRSLSDLLLSVETPFLTPLSSPSFFTPPMTPLESYSLHGFNPLFESSTDTEISKIKSSPPPKFKFLKDAEEKLLRRKLMEEDVKILCNKIDDLVEVDKMMKVCQNPSPSMVTNEDEEEGSFITILVAKNKEQNLIHTHSSSSQVLPLPSSPTTIRPSKLKTHVPFELQKLK